MSSITLIFRRSLTTIVVGALLLAPRNAAAAQAALPTPGARVRVTAPELEITKETGNLTGVTRDSLTIRFRGEEADVAIPIDRLSRLEVSTGKDRGAGFRRGAGWGVFAGAFLGVLYVASESGGDDSYPVAFVLGSVGGAVAGLIVGGLTGVALPADRWQEVSLGRQIGASRLLGTRVGFSVPF